MSFTDNSFLFESSFLGRQDYQTAFQIQENLWQFAKTKNQFCVMGLEHPAVITLGRRAQKSEVMTLSHEIPVVQSTRGGLATLHSEGQLVIYPIMNLRVIGLGVKEYVEQLLQITKKTFADFDVPVEIDTDRVGLYTAVGKIAFCGLEIRQGVSLHGLSINVCNDLVLFEAIRSCGVEKLAMDSLKNYRADVNIEQFFRLWMQNFRQSFLFSKF